MVALIINPTHEFPILQENLEVLYGRLDGDLTPLMRAIGVVLEGSTRQRFADKKSPDGISWANLMPETIARKKNKSVTKQGVTAVGTLVEHGDLFRSVTSHADKYSVSVGTNREYDIFHQLGTQTMDERPFLGISDDDEDEIYHVINDYLGNAL